MAHIKNLRRIPQLLILSVALVVVSACTKEAGESPTAPGLSSASEVEFQSFQLINDARQDNDVSPDLDQRDVLSEVARNHSRAMRDRGFFGHRDPEGKTVGDRLDGAGVNFRSAAENLVKVSSSVAPAVAAHDMLMGSGDHRENILDQGFRLAGVGVARSGNTYWVTQIFIKP